MQEERVSLRKSYREAQEKLEAERRQAPQENVPEAGEPDDSEDVGWTRVQNNKDRPVRLPVFTKSFRDSLDSVPKGEVSACLRRVGWMATGEAAAFLGDVKLEHRPEYHRLRIHKVWRLIYREEGDTLTIERLVHKSKLDLEVRRLPG